MMQAAYIEQVGGPIRFGRLPVPVPGPTDLLVRFEASEVNHVDLFVRSGAYRTHIPLPFVIGRDIVGTVVQAGDGVSRFAVGDRVWSNSLGYDGRQGTFAEFAVVPVERAYPLPDGVDPEDAAVVLHAGATAYLGLFRHAVVQAGETLAVHGAGGAVGSAAVQFALEAGVRVVATSSAGGIDHVRALGADVVLDHGNPGLAEQLRGVCPDGVDVWWDTSGRNDFGLSVPLLARGGRIVLMSGLRGEHPPLPVGGLYTKDASIRGFAMSNASVTDLADAARSVNRLLASGRLTGRLGATYSLAQARQAFEDLEQGRLRGRALVRTSS